MNHDASDKLIYHITDVSNLTDIIADSGLHSDAVMANKNPTVIGYGHIKERRLKQILVDCCGSRFVGEFVPFYFCPRSPMLYTINRGNTGGEPGCQKNIVHLVSSLAIGVSLGKDWAFSNGNASAYHTDFFSDLCDLAQLDWGIISSNDWAGDLRRHKKSSEFLLAHFFPWSAIRCIGCYNSTIAQQVTQLVVGQAHSPKVIVRTDWYY